jgi:anthranilate/para-aminobenzoate synthase component I
MAESARLASQRLTGLDGLAPVEAAGRLRHLPGLVFLDSAAQPPGEGAEPVSIIAARPTRVLRGSVFAAADRAHLEAVLAAHPAAADRGFPLGGLCGWVDYHGHFTFGVYPEMLVFSHADGTWHGNGGLADSISFDDAGDPARIGRFRPLDGRAGFLTAVQRAKEWIAAGDIYQVNLARCWEAEVAGGSLFPLYEHLRMCSPAPMAAWLSLAGREVLCSSPESFLRISGRGIETRPIKGTRPRCADPGDDRRSAYELQTSPKEIAELVMITDLLRNDLGQVCEFGSVEVTSMLALEQFAQVHHLVSTVTGTVRPEIGPVAALAACFPGGSITGAPKKRAREIIELLEPVPRGLYCGAIGVFGFGGESRFNIAIRTLVREGGRLRYHSGAGIVADSVPERELEEIAHKAAGIREAIKRWRAQRRWPRKRSRGSGSGGWSASR